MVFWGAAEFAGVVAAEMGGAFVSDVKSGARNRAIAARKKAASFDHAQVFLVLQRGGSGYGFEVLVE